MEGERRTVAGVGEGVTTRVVVRRMVSFSFSAAESLGEARGVADAEGVCGTRRVVVRTRTFSDRVRREDEDGSGTRVVYAVCTTEGTTSIVLVLVRMAGAEVARERAMSMVVRTVEAMRVKCIFAGDEGWLGFFVAGGYGSSLGLRLLYLRKKLAGISLDTGRRC